ncbi:hypothetical protein [Allobranchiibius sp. CTAmp26]|uniref:hypothetical protein n=1 Tax=Allobranchiibius sp. CTAmp26 TaxID=2815214 RepID=UPI001AA18D61|nr:hypothetical protein [Allobranchiibius sp. CTAmp26]MBO1754634.1 hypothetical protein [Allobranchiibius sp. CTAmp26]
MESPLLEDDELDDADGLVDLDDDVLLVVVDAPDEEELPHPASTRGAAARTTIAVLRIFMIILRLAGVR